MRVLSLFSGVGGMDLGLERAGHEVVGMCEIDKHARSVLARHWPDVPIMEDVTNVGTCTCPTPMGNNHASESSRSIADGELGVCDSVTNSGTIQCRDCGGIKYGRVDLVAGGSPCQDLSVAGKRGGLDGERSGLFWHQCRIADSIAAPWFLWENVAGALTSNNGADFAAVLWGITGALPDVPDEGWKSAGVCVGPKRTAVWRLLDAQWFGVAQRRRRVFIVAGPRGQCGPEVLLESESVSGNPAPSRAPREEIARTIGTRPQRSGELDNHGAYVKVIRSGARDTDGNLPPEVWRAEEVAPTLNQFDVGDTRATVAICFGWQENQLAGQHRADGTTDPLTCTKTLAVMHEPSVRRLTPRECERLMGWPDDWTRYTADGKEQADSHRYKQCGNGVVSNVAEWIGRRLP